VDSCCSWTAGHLQAKPSTCRNEAPGMKTPLFLAFPHISKHTCPLLMHNNADAPHRTTPPGWHHRHDHIPNAAHCCACKDCTSIHQAQILHQNGPVPIPANKLRSVGIGTRTDKHMQELATTAAAACACLAAAAPLFQSGKHALKIRGMCCRYQEIITLVGKVLQ
jgi:hypothetical protein